MPTEPFGPLQFQLVLLRRMADHQPGLVDDALRTLGVNHTDLREANRRWQARLHSRTFPSGEARYRTALGPPEDVREQRAGDLELRAALWPVPLWPDLRFEVVTLPGPGEAAPGRSSTSGWCARPGRSRRARRPSRTWRRGRAPWTTRPAPSRRRRRCRPTRRPGPGWRSPTR